MKNVLTKAVSYGCILLNGLLFLFSWGLIILKNTYTLVPNRSVFTVIVISAVMVLHLASLVLSRSKTVWITTAFMQLVLLRFFGQTLGLYPVEDTADVAFCLLVVGVYLIAYMLLKKENTPEAKGLMLGVRLLGVIQLISTAIILIFLGMFIRGIEPDYHSSDVLEYMSPDRKYVITLTEYTDGSHGHPDRTDVELYLNDRVDFGVFKLQTSALEHLYTQYDGEPVNIVWKDGSTVLINGVKTEIE